MSDSPPATSIPPRRGRWRRRLLIAGLFLLAAAAGLWAWAAWRLAHDGADADSAVAEADRLDPGWRLEELEAKRDDPPSAENGALKVLAWAKALPRTEALQPAEDLLTDWPPESRLTEPQLAALRTALAPAGPTLDEVRTLPRYPRGRYPVQWAPNPIDTVLPCQEARRVLAWLRADALARAEASDAGGALADCRAAFQVSRTVGDEPTAISQLVHIALRAGGVALLERVLAQGEPPADGLAELQRWLEAEEPAPLLLIMARGERACFVRSVDQLFGTMPTYQRLALSVTPQMSPARTRAVGLRYLNECVEAAKLPENQRAARLPTLAATNTLPIMVGLLVPALDKVSQACARSHAQMRCAIAAVAAERFRRDKGRWPESLAELVATGLLKTVPADPYDFQPLRLKRLPDGLVIYSVGPDGKDDGGTLNRQKPIEPGSDIGLRLWDVPARRQPPRPPKPPDPPADNPPS
jgi:hypothetical protein